MCVNEHITQANVSALNLSLLQGTNFIYITSILTIYTVLSLSRFHVKIYVHKHLTKKICSVLSLSRPVVKTYKIQVHDLKTDNISGPFSLML